MHGFLESLQRGDFKSASLHDIRLDLMKHTVLDTRC